MSLFPRIGEGVQAELVVGNWHLVLVCTETGVGPSAGLFNAKTDQWIDRQWAADIEDAKRKAEQSARELLRLSGVPPDTPFPTLEWKKAG
jgi:hypothetical protein